MITVASEAANSEGQCAAPRAPRGGSRPGTAHTAVCEGALARGGKGSSHATCGQWQRASCHGSGMDPSKKSAGRCTVLVQAQDDELFQPAVLFFQKALPFLSAFEQNSPQSRQGTYTSKSSGPTETSHYCTVITVCVCPYLPWLDAVEWRSSYDFPG